MTRVVDIREPTTQILRSASSNDGLRRLELVRQTHRGSIITKPGTVFYAVHLYDGKAMTDIWTRDLFCSAERRYRRELRRL